MSMLTDKYFRIALLISVFTHGAVLSPLPGFRFDRPSRSELRQVEIIYYQIKENPKPLQKITEAVGQLKPTREVGNEAKAAVEAPEEGNGAFANKEESTQKLEEPKADAKVEVKEVKPERLEVAKVKVLDENIPEPKDLSREEKPIFLDYFQAIREKIRRSTSYPPGARRNLIEGSTYLSFVLSNKGKLKEVTVKKSSGNRLLDQSTIQSIRDACPFPPFPKALKTPHLRLSVQISYQLD